jgi:hypothetical protein
LLVPTVAVAAVDRAVSADDARRGGNGDSARDEHRNEYRREYEADFHVPTGHDVSFMSVSTVRPVFATIGAG